MGFLDKINNSMIVNTFKQFCNRRHREVFFTNAPQVGTFLKSSGTSMENKTALLLDNHKSHISLAAFELCRTSGITLISFAPHTSHCCQPLDLTAYGVRCTVQRTIGVVQWVSSFLTAHQHILLFRLDGIKCRPTIRDENVAAIFGNAYCKTAIDKCISGFKQQESYHLTVQSLAMKILLPQTICYMANRRQTNLPQTHHPYVPRLCRCQSVKLRVKLQALKSSAWLLHQPANLSWMPESHLMLTSMPSRLCHRQSTRMVVNLQVWWRLILLKLQASYELRQTMLLLLKLPKYFMVVWAREWNGM